jgi:prefoldin subunit 5
METNGLFEDRKRLIDRQHLLATKIEQLDRFNPSTQPSKVKMNIGLDVFVNAQILSDKLLVKMANDMYVELTLDEAKKYVGKLRELYAQLLDKVNLQIAQVNTQIKVEKHLFYESF